MNQRLMLRSRLHLAGRFVLLGWILSLSLGVAQATLPDYDALDEILARNVRNGFVDYDGIAQEPRFAAFVDQLGSTRLTELDSEAARLAFYINAYNALAIQGILNGGSPTSWWGRRGFFRQQKFSVLGESMTLDMLEHERIATFGEARVHFAIVCASLSCPRLSGQAFRPETLNEQLHDAAKRFINDPTRNRLDNNSNIAFVSRIFDWYADDFIAAGGTQQRYLARFVADPQTEDFLRQEAFELRYLPYDWNLNGHYSKRD